MGDTNKSWMLICWPESGQIKQLDWNNNDCSGTPTSIGSHSLYESGYNSRMWDTVKWLEDVCTCTPCSYAKEEQTWTKNGVITEQDDFVFGLGKCSPWGGYIKSFKE